MSAKNNDGGSAFPLPCGHATVKDYQAGVGDFEKTVEVCKTGMSLRDYFAAKAMQEQIGFEGMEGCDKQQICAMAYELADAMIAEREKLK